MVMSVKRAVLSQDKLFKQTSQSVLRQRKSTLATTVSSLYLLAIPSNCKQAPELKVSMCYTSIMQPLCPRPTCTHACTYALVAGALDAQRDHTK